MTEVTVHTGQLGRSDRLLNVLLYIQELRTHYQMPFQPGALLTAPVHLAAYRGVSIRSCCLALSLFNSVRLSVI